MATATVVPMGMVRMPTTTDACVASGLHTVGAFGVRTFAINGHKARRREPAGPIGLTQRSDLVPRSAPDLDNNPLPRGGFARDTTSPFRSRLLPIRIAVIALGALMIFSLGVGFLGAPGLTG